MDDVYGFDVLTSAGETKSLRDYAGKVLLIVNTASKCGFTPQYAGLQELQDKFAEKNFSVLGFPCNQFGNQESGTDEEIQTFCQTNYHVTFPVFSKVNVNGGDAHPLYKYLTKERKGLLGSGMIKWNFTKFLVDAQGHVVKRYAPTVTPDQIERDIEPLMG